MQKVGIQQKIFWIIKINSQNASIIAISDRIAQRMYEQGFAGVVKSSSNGLENLKNQVCKRLLKKDFYKL